MEVQQTKWIIQQNTKGKIKKLCVFVLNESMSAQIIRWVQIYGKFLNELNQSTSFDLSKIYLAFILAYYYFKLVQKN